jgi:hypothetical protein
MKKSIFEHVDGNRNRFRLVESISTKYVRFEWQVKCKYNVDDKSLKSEVVLFLKKLKQFDKLMVRGADMRLDDASVYSKGRVATLSNITVGVPSDDKTGMQQPSPEEAKQVIDFLLEITKPTDLYNYRAEITNTRDEDSNDHPIHIINGQIK